MCIIRKAGKRSSIILSVRWRITAWRKKKKAHRKSTDNQYDTEIRCVESLKKYKELLDLGIITPEEFDAKKKQLLGP